MDKFDHSSIVDSVVRAGRSDNRSKSGGDAEIRQTLRGPARHVDPHFAALLSRLLAATTTASIPCVQFVACGAQNRATTIAFNVAQAASTVLGRTLLVNARLDLDGPFMGSEATHGPIPDAFIPGLYHYDIASRPGESALLFGGAKRATFQALTAPFRFVAIDCPAPSAGPAANALAALCMASVLVVSAGASTRESIRDAMRNVSLAGGTIIGTVLAGAPSNLPAWMTGL